jgi:hypothetical protein
MEKLERTYCNDLLRGLYFMALPVPQAMTTKLVVGELERFLKEQVRLNQYNIRKCTWQD